MEGLGSLLLFAVFFYIMMRFGCGAHMIHGGHNYEGSQTNPVDPVCNQEVDVNEGYGMMYKERLYRFCSRTCLEKFDNDPDYFINMFEKHHET